VAAPALGDASQCEVARDSSRQPIRADRCAVRREEDDVSALIGYELGSDEVQVEAEPEHGPFPDGDIAVLSTLTASYKDRAPSEVNVANAQ